MTGDHDKCEWVKFRLVLAHPGCPRQSPDSRKTVLCVCVFSYHCELAIA